jgi:hypothetical protein
MSQFVVMLITSHGQLIVSYYCPSLPLPAKWKVTTTITLRSEFPRTEAFF